MVAIGHSSVTDSPKVVVGEIDTSAPFRTVKDAVSRFGESALTGGNLAIQPAQAHFAERTLAKETQLDLARNVLYKLKGRLKNAETTKSQALEDLESARRTVEELTHKIKTVNESKNSAIKASEAAKNRAKQIEETNSSDLPGTNVVARSQDFETARGQHTNVITELDTAKQELRKVRQDRDASLETKIAAYNQAEEAEHAVKVNTEKVGALSREIADVQESIAKVKLASLKVQQEQAKTFAEKGTQRQLYKVKLEESAKRLLALKGEFDIELARNLESKLSETVGHIEELKKQIENAKASDQESVQAVTSELDGAKGSLQKIVDEENSLRSLVESLKFELENAKKEHSELKEKEAKTDSIAGNLHIKLRKRKYVLEAFLAEESKTRGAYAEMISTLKQLSIETENARREEERMKTETERLKMEAKASRVALEEAGKQLSVTLEEAEAAKEAETRALDQIKMPTERTSAARASILESRTDITISRAEVESLSHKVEELNNIAEMKVAAAKARVEAVKASEYEALKRFEAIQKEIEDMKTATVDALKRAEMAEAAKKAVEGELQRWREREQKKEAEAAKKAVEGELQRWREREQKKEAEAASQILAQSSPQQSRIQNQNPPAPPDKIVVQVQKLEISKSSLSTKKAVSRKFSSIFKRRNNQIDSGSPSYQPSEKSV